MATAPVPVGFRSRALTEAAVSAALEADWARALELNQKMLAVAPDDVEARNRFGRALLELGRLAEAKAAYLETLKSEPNNSVALRNVQRVGQLLDHKIKPNITKSKTQPRLFIEDMGKTGILRLINPAPPHIVAKFSPGAEVQLREHDGLLAVHARDGELLGFLEPKVGRRLLDLIHTGNEYVVAMVSNDQQNPRVAIRETHQSAENAGRISFPGHHRPVETKERAYIKGTFFRNARDDESADETDEVERAGTDESLDDDADRDAVEQPLSSLGKDDDDEDDDSEE